MKLGTATTLNKRNKTTPKNFMITSFRQIVTSLKPFHFMADFEQSGSWIPNA